MCLYFGGLYERDLLMTKQEFTETSLNNHILIKHDQNIDYIKILANCTDEN